MVFVPHYQTFDVIIEISDMTSQSLIVMQKARGFGDSLNWACGQGNCLLAYCVDPNRKAGCMRIVNKSVK